MKTAEGRGVALNELVARCARTEAQQRIRQVQSFTTTKTGEPKEVYMIALSMMNALLGHGQQGHLWWHVTAKELIAVRAAGRGRNAPHLPAHTLAPWSAGGVPRGPHGGGVQVPLRLAQVLAEAGDAPAADPLLSQGRG